MTPNFIEAVKGFNKMYGLPIAQYPTALLEPMLPRMDKFLPILAKEMVEGDDIVTDIKAGMAEIDLLVSMADWLGDMIVYCTSEALRYGIPIDEVLYIIMESNKSKLGADGQPIIKDGKVQKGPGYWKPQPLIKELLQINQVRGTNDPA